MLFTVSACIPKIPMLPDVMHPETYLKKPNMADQFYTAGLLEALDKIKEAGNSLFDGAVSIALHGDLKEWSDSVPEGETHLFEFSLLKNSEDANISMMVAMMEELERLYERICDLNAIDMEEK